MLIATSTHPTNLPLTNTHPSANGGNASIGIMTGTITPPSPIPSLSRRRRLRHPRSPSSSQPPNSQPPPRLLGLCTGNQSSTAPSAKPQSSTPKPPFLLPRPPSHRASPLQGLPAFIGRRRRAVTSRLFRARRGDYACYCCGGARGGYVRSFRFGLVYVNCVCGGDLRCLELG